MYLISLTKNFKLVVLITLSVILNHTTSFAAILEVGPGKAYNSPAQAAPLALPGDTILIYPGVYTMSNRITGLTGRPEAFIYIIGTSAETVIFEGNSQAFHFSDIAYVQIENITIEKQSANGMNMDDGGTFDTPSHHINILKCIFRNMASQGNNDLLKLSGIDYFQIEDCLFLNGATGGSGIDMVGCHNGNIRHCTFENMGSNAIQAKGGSQYLLIEANRFKNCGQRTLNLGGSTGLEFFRPQDAPFEAADIEVFANIFIGSTAPIAFVGCTRVQVINNTIIDPVNWVIRILQETFLPARFVPCSYNSFVNNIIYHSNTLSRHVNIGPNTLPASFTFSHNLWYNYQSPENSIPDLPVNELFGIRGMNPLFELPQQENYALQENSPAIDAARDSPYTSDYFGHPVPSGNGHDIGAIEYQQTTRTTNSDGVARNTIVKVFPNPFKQNLNLQHNHQEDVLTILIFNGSGQCIFKEQLPPGNIYNLNTATWTSGIYFLNSRLGSQVLIKQE